MSAEANLIGEMYKALARAQAKIKSAKKESPNPHFGSKYADLASTTDAIRDALTGEGFGWTQMVDSTADGVTCVTRLLHSSGCELVGGKLWLPVLQKTPQAYGSTITYARRYSLGAAVGVASDEDDDGNAASKAPVAPPAGAAAVRAQAVAAPRAAASPQAGPPEPPPIGEEYAPNESAAEATHDRNITFAYGNGKGTPLKDLDDNSVSFYKSGCQRTLADPAKAKFHAKETLNLATLNAELRLRGLPA